MLKQPLDLGDVVDNGGAALNGAGLEAPHIPGDSDELLVESIRLGEIDRFSVLIQRHNRRLYRVARSILKDEQEAEDVVQQTHLSAYLHLHEFEGRSKFSTWLARIATHEALARLRARRRGAAITAEDADRSVPSGPLPHTPEEVASQRELARTLEAAIDELPDSYRAAFVLRHVEGLDTDEAAAWLGVSEENLRVRLHRARLLLKDRILEQVQATAEEVFSFGGDRCVGHPAAEFLSVVPANAPVCSPWSMNTLPLTSV